MPLSGWAAPAGSRSTHGTLYANNPAAAVGVAATHLRRDATRSAQRLAMALDVAREGICYARWVNPAPATGQRQRLTPDGAGGR